ncbi:MAG: hypothetical protein UHN59_08730 [Bacteroidales bacterium]|nr:hypothetical protein [Bacteroidales bacterium]
MKDFTSKLSLYDILTQLISGFLILAFFIPIPESTIKCMCMEDSTETYHWIFVLIFSYLIGIIYHRWLEWIRSGGLCECIKKWLNDECIKKLINIKKLLNEKYLIFYIRTIFKRNYKYAIIRAYRYVYYKDKKISFETYDITESILGIDINEYYKTYYSIMDKPAYNTIMFLEAQEAFLRNITWIVLFYLCCAIFSGLENGVAMKIMLEINYAWILLLIILILILFARYQTQMKVYKAVWEAGKYL